MNEAPNVVGTMAVGMPHTWSWIEALDPADIDYLCCASAYWDETSCDFVIDLARTLHARARLVLWTAGGKRAGWEAAERASHVEELDLRFVDSPAERGIFHVKLTGAIAIDGTWAAACVGSANLTAAAREKNVELGVVVRERSALAPLEQWYSTIFDAALPASEMDWKQAIAIAPESSEAAERSTLYRKAALAHPVRT